MHLPCVVREREFESEAWLPRSNKGAISLKKRVRTVLVTILYGRGSRGVFALMRRSSTEQSIRVAAQGCDDVPEFALTNGRWISEDCEPVQVEFAYRGNASQIKEKDCICSHEFAAALIHLLFAGENERQVVPVSEAMAPPVYHQMV